MKPIQERIRQYGLDPTRAANSIDQLATLWTHPELGPVVREFFATQQVKFPGNGHPAAPTEPESYVDPDLKAMREEMAAKLGEMDKRIGAWSATSQTTASAQVAQTLRGYEDQFLAQIPATDEQKEEFRTKMNERFEWMVKNQPQALVQLQRDTYEDLAVPVMHRVANLLSLGERAATTKQQGQGRATDARFRAPSTGTEQAATAQSFDHTPTPTEIQTVARAALDRIQRERASR